MRSAGRLLGFLVVGVVFGGCGRLGLGPAGTNDDRMPSAMVDLTNGLTEAAAQYSANSNSYEAVNAGLLNTVAPEFSWSAGGPTVGAPTNAISVDSCADGPDCQAVVLASYLSGTHQCWYAAMASSVQAAVALGLPGQGTFYGLRRFPQTCSAGTPGQPTQPPSGWWTTYSSASVAGSGG